MSQKQFARKKRQLAQAVKELNGLLLQTCSGNKNLINRLVARIRRLISELGQLLSVPELKRILGSTAVLIGIPGMGVLFAQSFEGPGELPSGILYPYSLAIPALCDLDDDGDLDLMIGNAQGKLYYYENTGTAIVPQFGQRVENPFGINPPQPVSIHPAFADLDHDGDADLITGSRGGQLHYFENTGDSLLPIFAEPVLNPFGIVPQTSVYTCAVPVDIDKDGDFDLFVGRYFGDFYYLENTGDPSYPQFGEPVENPFGLIPANGTAAPAFADLDRDGDEDLVAGELGGDFLFFDNTGTERFPVFAEPVEHALGLVIDSVNYAFPSFADLDGDGDPDLVIGDSNGKIIYFENTSSSGIINLHPADPVRLFPNPAGSQLFIETGLTVSRMEVLNMMGISFSVQMDAPGQVDVSFLKPGMYLLKLHLENGGTAVTKFHKQ